MLNNEKGILTPLKNESFKDFFIRTYNIVKEQYPKVSFWLLETMNRRISYAGGEMDVMIVKPVYKKITEEYKLAFDNNLDLKIINEVFELYLQIHQNNFKG